MTIVIGDGYARAGRAKSGKHLPLAGADPDPAELFGRDLLSSKFHRRCWGYERYRGYRGYRRGSGRLGRRRWFDGLRFLFFARGPEQFGGRATSFWSRLGQCIGPACAVPLFALSGRRHWSRGCLARSGTWRAVRCTSPIGPILGPYVTDK